jgi:hypothetical protein
MTVMRKSRHFYRGALVIEAAAQEGSEAAG